MGLTVFADLSLGLAGSAFAFVEVVQVWRAVAVLSTFRKGIATASAPSGVTGGLQSCALGFQ